MAGEDSGRTAGGVQTATREPAQPGEALDTLDTVRRYVLLSIVVRILDHDIRVVGASQLKLPRFHESMLRGIQDRVLLDLAATRKSFRSSGIKVYEERRKADGLAVAYVAKGSHRQFTMPWSAVRAEAERLLRGYTGA